MAREYAEMALRDAERDILGLRFNGLFCVGGGVPCGLPRPAGTRPTNDGFAGNFWTASNTDVVDIPLVDGGVGQPANVQGVYRAGSAVACGEPVWSGADWEDNVVRSCGGVINASVPTVPYGRFTDAPFVGPNGVAPPQGIPRPRYLIEMFTADELATGLPNVELGTGMPGGTVNKIFFRITAVGFGKTVGPAGTGRMSVTLQSVFSPI
jgi:Tfp pilus assembly protein PilX